jgi:NADH-quinone oxidoreductase subunit G
MPAAGPDHAVRPRPQPVGGAKRHKHKNYPISDTIVLDQERCVVCWRCIRYLEEWEDKPQLGLFERGGETIIDIQDGQPVDAKTGGNIIDICPVGALTNKVARFSFRPWEIERTPSICTHCSMGCNIRMDTPHPQTAPHHRPREHAGQRPVDLRQGALRPRLGQRRGRLTMPLVRKDGKLQPAPWSEALALVAEKLQASSGSTAPTPSAGSAAPSCPTRATTCSSALCAS